MLGPICATMAHTGGAVTPDVAAVGPPAAPCQEGGRERERERERERVDAGAGAGVAEAPACGLA